MSIYLRIKNNFDTFSKSEKRVARYCLDNFLSIGDLTLHNIAEEANVGEATIFRFCKKIDFDSFQDFKTELLNEVKNDAQINEESFVFDIYKTIQDSIEFTIQNLNHNELDEAAKKLYDSRHIFCVGVGNSATAAESCAMRFLRNGVNATFIKDTHFQAIYLAQLTEDDCAIIFSSSGESNDIIHIAKILSSRNVPMIGVTSSVVSTIAKLSAFHFLTKNTISHISGGNMISQISQMYVANLLTARVAMFDSKKMAQAKETTFDYIYDKMSYTHIK